MLHLEEFSMCPKICGWAFLILLSAGTMPARAGLVISQIYGGGGNTGSTLRTNFIYIFHASDTTANLIGMSVQYASAAGGTWSVTQLTPATLHPGQYYLIQEASGGGGVSNLPDPDVKGSINLSATAGKVALVNGTTALSGSSPSTGFILDLVGYGGATFFEGVGPAPSPSNTTSIFRLGGGLTDTNDNSQDFTTGLPDPRNTSSAFNPPPQSVPEPSTLILGVIGMLGVFLVCRGSLPSFTNQASIKS
jgi:uncharacterized protein